MRVVMPEENKAVILRENTPVHTFHVKAMLIGQIRLLMQHHNVIALDLFIIHFILIIHQLDLQPFDRFRLFRQPAQHIRRIVKPLRLHCLDQVVVAIHNQMRCAVLPKI